MALLSSGHLATDFANGALPALLPFLRERFSLSCTTVGGVVLASQASSSLIQPLFGLWSDRRGAMWLLPSGVALAGIGIALAADAPSYWLVLLLVLGSGVGVAAFHPEGSKFAGFVSGRKRASGMAWFSLGGNLGYALGPLAATAVVAALGLRGGFLLALPCLAVALAIVAATPYLRGFAPEPTVARVRRGDDDRDAMKLLLGVIALGLIGACVVGTFGVTMVMGQEYMPNHIGTASGLVIGLSVGLGGVAAVALGRLADATSLHTALLVAAGAPLLAIALAAKLPSRRAHPKLEPEPELGLPP